MGLCKEMPSCKPLECKKSAFTCGKGKVLRNLPPKCGEVCLWMTKGIDGTTPCKDASCSIGNKIIEIRNENN